MLDHIGLEAGWRCLDLGCGAMGILGPLSRRVGSAGQVIGVDLDARQLAAARAFIQEAGLRNVEIVEQDAYHTTFPRESFDLVHVRFVFAPVGRDEDLVREMIALTKPDRKSTRLNSSHQIISYAVFCLKKKKKPTPSTDSSEHATHTGLDEYTQR